MLGYRIEADQAKAVGALLLLILIPIWQNIVIPTLLVYNIRICPLKSMAIGGFCAVLAFFCAGLLQVKIEQSLLSNNSEQWSILWQFPQFLLIMLGECTLSIPGLSFSFTQSPYSMRSVMTAAWFCNNAFGNLIVIAITELKPFKLQSSGYFSYAFLMFVAIAIFCWLASSYRYTYYDNASSSNDADAATATADRNDNLFKRRSSNLPYSTLSSQDGLDLLF